MATISISIDGAERTIDPDDLTLGFQEDMEIFQESGKASDLIPAIAGLLGIERAAARRLTVRQLKQITAAIQEASRVDPTTA